MMAGLMATLLVEMTVDSTVDPMAKTMELMMVGYLDSSLVGMTDIH